VKKTVITKMEMMSKKEARKKKSIDKFRTKNY